MFNWYDLIMGFYRDKLWNIDQVREAVVREKITEEQFTEITGEAY